MKIATAAYPLDVFEGWTDYEAKLTRWIADAAGQGADLLVFPEYGAMELASLGGPDLCADLQASSRYISDLMPKVQALHLRLAQAHGVHVLGASGPVLDGDRIVNRAYLYTPNGLCGFQDKVIMTLWERAPWGVVGRPELKVFDTALGRIAINICYDSEFPLLARAQSEAELLLVPSCTELLEGYWRVRIGTMARALEGQCVAVMASVVGAYPLVEAVDRNCGMGGIFGPPDKGFPPTGVLAEGVLDQPGWTFAEVDPGAVARARAQGNVRNHRDWSEQPAGVAAHTELLR